MITDCIQSMSSNLEKTDLIIRVISRRTTHENMKDFNDLIRVLRLATNHFQISFELSYETDFIAPNFSQFINIWKTQYCVIVAPKDYCKVSFLVKSKDWNFIETVDCKPDTYCPHCIPNFWFWIISLMLKHIYRRSTVRSKSCMHACFNLCFSLKSKWPINLRTSIYTS